MFLVALSLTGCRQRNRQRFGFEDVAASMGVTDATYSGSVEKVHIRESLGQGACWIDFDRDTDLDLFVPNGASKVGDDETTGVLYYPWHFYLNEEGRFTEAADKVGLSEQAWGIGCAVGDVDGDGFDDLFVTTAGSPNRLFHNRGNGTFEDWTERSQIGSPLLSTGASFGDLDADGDLDLVVVTYVEESETPPQENCRWKGTPVMCGPKSYRPLDDLLYINDGHGKFVETGELAGYPGYGLSALLFDAESDGDLDIFVANDSSPNHLFLNDGNARFEELGLAAGLSLSSSGTSQAGMGVDAGDLDGDGRLDLVVTNFSDDINNFYRNDGDCLFSEWSQRSGLAALSFTKLGWSVLLEDFDLDGDLDVFIANGHVYPEVGSHDPNTSYKQCMQLLTNDGTGHFQEDKARLGPIFNSPIAGRGAAIGDFDEDGDFDVVVTRDREPPLLLRNNLPAPDSHWLKVRLISQQDNHEAIGARVELRAGGREQVREVRRSRGYLSTGTASLIFGLGNITRVDSLTIYWPGGRKSQSLTDLSVDQELHVFEETMKIN